MYHFGVGSQTFDIQIDAVEASSSGADAPASILFPDKDLLFTAEFKRVGADLLLIGDGKTAVVLDYFKDERRPSLVTPDGASLTGATVEALAGPDAPGEYAEIAPVAATRIPIGRVEKVSGSATVLRNGIPVELHLGDVVAKGDVVQTSSGSALTIKLTDGTVFGLSSSARIVLSDMVYAADSSSNSAVFTLVQGVIGFVAGKIAKTGDLRVETPVATLAIRGTAVRAEIAASSGATKLSLLTEPDGRAGSFTVLDKNDPSRVITTISDPRVATVLTPTPGADPILTQVAKTADDLRVESNFVRGLFQIVTPEPRRRGSIDSDDSPLVPVNLQNLIDLPETGSIFRFIAPERAAPAPVVTIPPALEPIRGSAVEDGPLVRLVAQNTANTKENAAPPTVQVPSSLPPGVRFVKESQSFALDPSHPAYQHLGEGESTTVTVNYTVVIDDVPVPTSVSWTVTGQNDVPVATSDHITVRDVGERVLVLRGNDRDADGDALEIVDWTKPPKGSVHLDGDGNLVFDPGEDFRDLGAGETATISFTYTVSDGEGGTDTTTVTLEVIGKNDLPVAVGDGIAVEEAGEQVLALRANDHDVDGDALQIVGWTAPQQGSVHLNADGDLVFDPGEDFRALTTGETATVSFSYTVSDGQGGTDTTEVTLEVIGRNDAPIADDDERQVAAAALTVLALRANDRDAEGSALAILDWTAPPKGSVHLNADGDLVFDPGEDFRDLGAGETATVSFTYTLSDGEGGTDTAKVTLEVIGQNDAPTAVRDHLAVQLVGQQILGVLANDHDVDGDPLQIVGWTAPPEGSVHQNADGDFVFDPGEDFHDVAAGEIATVSFTYTVSDGQGGTDTTTVTLEVTGQNDLPVAVQDHLEVQETGEQVLAVRANDLDVDEDALQIVDWTDPLEGSLHLNAAGDLVFDPGEDFSALSSGETATVSFTYTVSDGEGGTDTAEVTLQVIGSGTFSSPSQTASTNAVLGFNHQPASLSIDAPSTTTSPTTDFNLSISLGPVVQPKMNIVYLIDMSSSTLKPFVGSSVGDVNGDGFSNTVIDAEIASLITLTDRAGALGFSPDDVTVTVIPFNDSADPASGSGAEAGPLEPATFSLGEAGEAMIADYLKDISVGAAGTDFADALRAANDELQTLDQGGESNFLYFLSDGFGKGAFQSELARLNDAFDTTIEAVGIGANSSLSLLNVIDNTDGASRLTAPEQIDVSVLGSPIPSGTIADLDIIVNGTEAAEFDEDDLVATPDGFVLEGSVGGLQRLVGDKNTVTATITFTSGDVLTTQLTIAGALPLSADFAVLGG